MSETEAERIERKATEALDVAYEARRRIDSHDELCAERYKGIRDTMGSIGDDVKTLANRMWLAAGSVIAACIGVIMFLASKIQ